MTLAERLQAAMVAAMRERDDARRDALRMAIAALQRAEKDARRPLNDDEQVGVLVREVRTRRESLDAFAKGGRPDLVAKEQAALDVLAPFMPAQLSEEELQELILVAIEETGAQTPRDMGRVMKALAPRVRGRVDGRAVNTRVTRELARRSGGS